MCTIYNSLPPQVIHVLFIRNNVLIPTILGVATYCELPKGSINCVNISTRLWNVLLLNINVNVSITTFKHNLKTYLLHNTVELKHPR